MFVKLVSVAGRVGTGADSCLHPGRSRSPHKGKRSTVTVHCRSQGLRLPPQPGDPVPAGVGCLFLTRALGSRASFRGHVQTAWPAPDGCC